MNIASNYNLFKNFFFYHIGKWHFLTLKNLVIYIMAENTFTKIVISKLKIYLSSCNIETNIHKYIIERSEKQIPIDLTSSLNIISSKFFFYFKINKISK